MAGSTVEELKLASAALASGRAVVAGQQRSLAGARVPVYEPYGAPRWIRTDRPVQLGELIKLDQLQGVGIPPGPLALRFRAPPDLFFWPRDGGALDVRYRYPTADWLDQRASRLDVSMNGQYLETLPLAGGAWLSALFGQRRATSVDRTKQLVLPHYALYGQNQLTFDYNLVLANKKKCTGTVPDDVHVSILPNSSIDLTDAYHAVQMPNLAAFANAGYPFTVRPDLADTAVVMARTPEAGTIEAFLTLMGRFGDSTGAAVSRVRVTDRVDEDRFGGRDVIVLGNASLVGSSGLFDNAPLSVRDGRMTLETPSPLEQVFADVSPYDRRGEDAGTFMETIDDFLGIVEFQSPLSSDRTVVAILADNTDKLPLLVANMADAKINAQIQGDLSLFNGDGMTSFAVGPTYWSGYLPFWMRIAYWFSSHPFLLAACGLLVAILLTGPVLYVMKRQERLRLERGEEA